MERTFLFYPLLALGLGWNRYKPELTMTTGQGLGPTLTSAEMTSPSELTNKLAVVSNTSVQLVGHVINVLFGLAITGLLARYLGVEGFGELSLALVYFSLIGILANWGFSTILVREISRLGRWDEGIINAWISSGIFWSLVSTVGAATVLLCILTVVDYAPAIKLRIFIMGLVHFTLILNVFDVLFSCETETGVYGVGQCLQPSRAPVGGGGLYLLWKFFDVDRGYVSACQSRWQLCVVSVL